MWNSSAGAVNAAHLELHSVTETLLQDWGDEQADCSARTGQPTETSLSTSYDAMAPVQGALNALAGQIRTTASTVETQVDALNEVVKDYNSRRPQPRRKQGYLAASFEEVEWAEKAKSAVARRRRRDDCRSRSKYSTRCAVSDVRRGGKLKWEGSR